MNRLDPPGCPLSPRDFGHCHDTLVVEPAGFARGGVVISSVREYQDV